MSKFEGKLALVTGASRGIGYHCALALAKEGAHVIGLARTVGGLEELDDEIQSFGGQATLVPHDLMDFEGTDRLGAVLFERWKALDILVLNGGILGGLSPLDHFDHKTFEKVMATNVTGNWRLMRSLSPLLRNSSSARIAVLFSSIAEQTKPFWGAYAASQAALKTLVETWAAENEKTEMKMNLFDPGPTNTALRAQAMPGEDKNTLTKPENVAQQILPILEVGNTKSGSVFKLL